MAQFAIDTERLARVTHLAKGAHQPTKGEMCAMEAVAFIAGEPWSDHPKCASQVIGALLRTWNDQLSDDDRNALILPFIPRLVGTKGSAALERRRATMAADWMVRDFTPAWLRLAGLNAEADALSSLPEIIDFANTPLIKAPLEAARKSGDAARDAARDAAWDAALAAAGGAAGDAAQAAAWDAAQAAAGGAAWAAARDTARDTAWAAARDTAGAALNPTAVALQASALALIERMIDAKEAA